MPLPGHTIGCAVGSGERCDCAARTMIAPSNRPHQKSAPVHRCRFCGCTEDNAILHHGRACWWIAPGICSACAIAAGLKALAQEAARRPRAGVGVVVAAMVNPKTHSMREAAALLGVHAATLYRWDGKHPAPIRRAARDRRRRLTSEDIGLIRDWMLRIETATADLPSPAFAEAPAITAE